MTPELEEALAALSRMLERGPPVLVNVPFRTAADQRAIDEREASKRLASWHNAPVAPLRAPALR